MTNKPLHISFVELFIFSSGPRAITVPFYVYTWRLWTCPKEKPKEKTHFQGMVILVWMVQPAHSRFTSTKPCLMLPAANVTLSLPCLYLGEGDQSPSPSALAIVSMVIPTEARPLHPAL